MKKWIVREKQIVTRYWEYQVESETEEEAVQKVSSGEVEEGDYFTSEDPIETEVEEIEE